jgi:hypothetical protein
LTVDQELTAAEHRLAVAKASAHQKYNLAKHVREYLELTRARALDGDPHGRIGYWRNLVLYYSSVGQGRVEVWIRREGSGKRFLFRGTAIHNEAEEFHDGPWCKAIVDEVARIKADAAELAARIRVEKAIAGLLMFEPLPPAEWPYVDVVPEENEPGKGVVIDGSRGSLRLGLVVNATGSMFVPKLSGIGKVAITNPDPSYFFVKFEGCDWVAVHCKAARDEPVSVAARALREKGVQECVLHQATNLILPQQATTPAHPPGGGTSPATEPGDGSAPLQDGNISVPDGNLADTLWCIVALTARASDDDLHEIADEAEAAGFGSDMLGRTRAWLERVTGIVTGP